MADRAILSIDAWLQQEVQLPNKHMITEVRDGHPKSTCITSL